MNKLEKLVREGRKKVSEAGDFIDTAVEETECQIDKEILEEIGLQLDETFGKISRFVKERI